MKNYKQLLEQLNKREIAPYTGHREYSQSELDALDAYDPALRFAKYAHESTRKNIDPTEETTLYRTTSDNKLVNVNVHFDDLHRDFKDRMHSLGNLVYFAALEHQDNDEDAARELHDSWAEHHGASPLPYDRLEEYEKNRGRSYIRLMRNLINQKDNAMEKMRMGQNIDLKESMTSDKNVRLLEDTESINEVVKYHLQNKISLVENIFRPGSEKFFDTINEAKRLAKFGHYEPQDELEEELLNSDIGEIAEYEGNLVVLDFPIDEEKEADDPCWKGYVQRGMKKKNGKKVPNCIPMKEEKSSDPTKGKGINKPWREGGGGAVYVKKGGRVIKLSFSKSGMKKKFNDPNAVKRFTSRHNCLSNKDKTSAAYWACRWPRYFSNSGKKWW
jgi:hypothetical protein